MGPFPESAQLSGRMTFLGQREGYRLPSSPPAAIQLTPSPAKTYNVPQDQAEAWFAGVGGSAPAHLTCLWGNGGLYDAFDLSAACFARLVSSSFSGQTF